MQIVWTRQLGDANTAAMGARERKGNCIASELTLPGFKRKSSPPNQLSPRANKS